MKKILALALIFAMLFAMTACGGNSGDEIKIGVISPLTGEVAVYGTAVRNAVELYTEQFNANGGVNGKEVKLIIYDDKGDATEALNAYNKLVNSDEVSAIIGPVTSAPCFGVAQQSVYDNMPCVTGTATHPSVTTYGKNFFRACFEDPFQGGTIARYAAAEMGAKTAAIIYNNGDAYSTGLMEAFVAGATENGVEITATESYGKGDVDFKAQLTNIAQVDADVLFIPDYYNNCYLICSQAREMGIDATFLGVDGTDGVLEIDGADTSVFDGMIFVNHYAADDDSETVQNFIAAYTEKYDAAPNALAALGYDATKILFDALVRVDNSELPIDSSDESREAIISALSESDIDCVTGHVTFDENNNPVKDCTIITIEDGAYHFVTKY